jgi:hypothetical protein
MKAIERERRAAMAREGVLERKGVVERARRRFGAARFAMHRSDDDPLDARQLRANLGDLRGDLEFAPTINVTVARDQHLRFDLPQAIQDAGRAEIRRARRPDGADRRGGEHRDDGLGDVRQDGRDAIARAHAGGREKGAKRRNVGAQLGPTHAPARAIFNPRNDCVPLAFAREQVLGEVEPRLREKARFDHRAAGPERRRAAFADDAAEVPDRFPERRRFSDRPRMESGELLEGESALARQPIHVGFQIRSRDALGRRAPEDLARRAHVVSAGSSRPRASPKPTL